MCPYVHPMKEYLQFDAKQQERFLVMKFLDWP